MHYNKCIEPHIAGTKPMVEFRLGDIFQTDVVEPEHHYIYVVRDGETVLYVGKSVQPFYRLVSQHCHYTSPSYLGRVIKDNRPASDDWAYTLYHTSELIEEVKYALGPDEAKLYRRNLNDIYRRDYCINSGELALIVKLRPLLNSMHADLKPYHERIREPQQPLKPLVGRKPRGAR